MQKRELCIGCTVRLKSSLKVGQIYGKDCFIELLKGMKTDERLTVRCIDKDGSIQLGQRGNLWYWYTVDMIDMRTVRYSK